MISFPLESLSDERRGLGLVFAVVVGTAFGFVLERSGFGRAQKLAGQFYGTDMTVLKVMFTSIATAMLGLVILSGAGLLDLGAVQIYYPTYLWPQIVGGLALGAGFVVSSYCPGTSIVASASGKVDGIVTVAGVMIGTLVYAEVEPALGAFRTSGDLGVYTLASWLGVGPAVVVAIVIGVCVLAFVAAERIERALAGSSAGVRM